MGAQQWGCSSADQENATTVNHYATLGSPSKKQVTPGYSSQMEMTSGLNQDASRWLDLPLIDMGTKDEDDEKIEPDVYAGALQLVRESWFPGGRPRPTGEGIAERSAISCAAFLACTGTFGVTMALTIAAIKYQLRKLKEAKLAFENVFGDVTGNLMQPGLPQLAREDAIDYCGDFADNYDNGFFSYVKSPLKTWDVRGMTSESRSHLDAEIYVLEPMTWFTTSMYIIGFTWSFIFYKEIISIKDLFCASWTRQDTLYDLQVGYVTLLRLIIACTLYFTGLLMFFETRDLFDLIMNSLGLTFLLEIDMIIFNTIVHAGEKISIPMLPNIADNRRRKFGLPGAPVQGVCSVVMITLALATSTILRQAQILHAEKVFSKISILCLFLGPTPNGGQKFQSTFAVPGFCESLLGIECQLPQEWLGAKCLYDAKNARSEICARYDALPLNATHNLTLWKEFPKTAPVCKFFPNNTDVKHPGREFSILYGKPWWSNPTGLLKWACSEMLDHSPAVEAITYHNQVPLSPAPPNSIASRILSLPNSGERLESFYRMREVSKGTNLFAGPFYCGLNDTGTFRTGLDFKTIFGDGVSDLPFIHRSGLFLDNFQIDLVVKTCHQAATKTTFQGVADDPCMSHKECRGFCMKRTKNTGVCRDCSRCKDCRTGLPWGCGACNTDLDCYHVNEGLQPMMQAGWTQHIDKMTNKSFFWHSSTNISRWETKCSTLIGFVAQNCAACAAVPPGNAVCVACWPGSELQLGTKVCSPSPIIAASVSAGDDVAFLKKDGSVWTYGKAGKGIFRQTSRKPMLVTSMWKVADVSVGEESAIFLKADGSVWAAGLNVYKHIRPDVDLDENIRVPAPTEVLKDIAYMSVSPSPGPGADAFFLSKDGSTWAWVDSLKTATLMPGMQGLVAAGWLNRHPVILEKNGRVFSASLISDDLVGDEIHGLQDIASVAQGSKNIIALVTSNGSAWILEKGQKPARVFGLNNVRSVAVGAHHAIFLTADGSVWSSGEGPTCLTGSRACDKDVCRGNYSNRLFEPKLVELNGTAKVSNISAGTHSTWLVLTNGTILMCGRVGHLWWQKWSPGGLKWFETAMKVTSAQETVGVGSYYAVTHQDEDAPTSAPSAAFPTPTPASTSQANCSLFVCPPPLTPRSQSHGILCSKGCTALLCCTITTTTTPIPVGNSAAKTVASSASQLTSASKYIMKPNMGSGAGNLIKEIDSTTVEACKTECSALSLCKAFTFRRVTTASTVGSCKLKTKFAGSPTNGKDTYVKEAELTNLGSAGCSTASKCEVCEGDCDSDAHCESGLTCFQRSDKTSVPGCIGGGSGDKADYDYCYEASDSWRKGCPTTNSGSEVGCTDGSTCDRHSAGWNCCGTGKRARCPKNWKACNDAAGNGADFSCWRDCTTHGGEKKICQAFKFTKYAGKACQGRNELGSSSGLTLELAKRKCANTAECVSFEKWKPPGTYGFSTTCDKSFSAAYANYILYVKATTAAPASAPMTPAPTTAAPASKATTAAPASAPTTPDPTTPAPTRAQSAALTPAPTTAAPAKA